MNPRRFITASLWHYRRIHVAVALGVAVAAAVLTGALLVGDSVRGSLRDLTLQRLGRIDQALVTGHLFRAALAEELAADAGFGRHFAGAEPAILMTGTLESGDGARRATHVSVIGCRDSFWSFGTGGPQVALAKGDVAVSESLAGELGVAAGDTILLRTAALRAIPADSPLGNKDVDKTTRSRRLRVAAALPDDGLARFAVRPSQHLPRNVFVPLATLQDLLQQPGKANALLVAGRDAGAAPDAAASPALAAAFRPRLEDFGIRLQRLTSPTACVQISADRLVLPDAVVAAARRAFGKDACQPIVTYLANTLVVGERKIPYSTITGVDSTAGLGPLRDDAGQPISIQDDEIVLNRWAADELRAEFGDTVTVNYYEPESTHGRLREHQPPAKFRLAHVAELETANGPSGAADPKLTPELPGVTDQRSISDWDLPFELVEEIRPQDEEYWDQYRTTPKAFVSLATAKRLWTSRWGTISLLRLGVDGSAGGNPRELLLRELDPAALGMTFLPVKEQGLAASSGTTPFDGLFLAFSFFLIAAAVMLIALLFQLGVQQRSRELGILAAAGLPGRQIVRLLVREGLIVAAIGAAVGAAAGVLYARLIIAGLRTWWVAAIGTPFLALHVTSRSLAIGWLVGVLVTWLTTGWSIRRLVRLPVGRLLAGDTEPANAAAGARRFGRWAVVRGLLIVTAVALGAAGYRLRGEAQAGVFFGSGATVLVLLLGELSWRMRAARRNAPRGRWTLTSLAALNTARHPGRSTLTIGLVASASFLIVATSVFRLDTTEQGTGGFVLTATSDRPIHYDLNTPDGRRELAFTDEESRQLARWRIYALRVHEGEDASCLNLYRPALPTVLGVPDALVRRGGFAWTAAADLSGERISLDNPWTLLEADLGPDDAGRPVVPVVLDMNTAVYSLGLKGVGSRLPIRDGDDRPVTAELVGLLKNSVLQGRLLVSEASFLRLFPETGGYRFFLIETRRDATPTDQETQPNAAELAAMLESALGDDGFDAADARQELAGFHAVQNTYLSTFQSLGALGLLLGTIGLAVVELRSVLERRGELALMRAAGFGRRRLVWMIVGENAVLLSAGLVVGGVAAAVATMPQWATQSASVPWATLAALLGAIIVVGLAAGWLATRSALGVPLLPALRGD